MVRTALVLVAVALAPAGAGADTQYVSGRALDACQAFDTTLGGLEDGSLDGRTARARFLALWPVLRKAGPVLGRGRRWAWMFPLPGYDAGCFGLSYDPDGYRFLDGPRARGYAGLRLYIRDGGRRGLEDRTGRPEPVVSATDGVVVASHPYRRGDGGPWGGYCMVYDRRGGCFSFTGIWPTCASARASWCSKGKFWGGWAAPIPRSARTIWAPNCASRSTPSTGGCSIRSIPAATCARPGTPNGPSRPAWCARASARPRDLRPPPPPFGPHRVLARALRIPDNGPLSDRPTGRSRAQPFPERP